jgi:C-terminal processing protease CtpA/Prc
MHSVISQYVSFEQTSYEEMYSYGFINENIGYMWIKKFQGEGMSASVWAKDAGEQIKTFESCKALIMDVRNNDGGNLLNAEEILQYFITENIVDYSTQYWKTGPGYNDYQQNKSGSIKKADYTFNKPVILLMNTGCVSTTDFFGILMKHNNLAILVGDSNIISIIGDTYPVELPNGWLVQFGRFAHEVYDGQYSEGDVLQMDHEVTNTKEELEEGIDNQLEYALQLIDSM